jgi:hypothetical protein
MKEEALDYIDAIHSLYEALLRTQREGAKRQAGMQALIAYSDLWRNNRGHEVERALFNLGL